MRLRSLLFVPGDRPDRMHKALETGADAIILDLEDSVAPSAKAQARAAVAGFLRAPRQGVSVFVRVNPLDGGATDADLDAVLAGRPDGLMLPKAEGAAALRDFDARLDARGADARLTVLPIAGETPGGVLRLGELGGVSARLVGVTWGAEDLSAIVGSTDVRDAEGRLTSPYRLARDLTLFGAAAAGVAAIETVYPPFRDLEGLRAFATRAAHDGFVGMMAIHPTQVAPINAAFTPAPEVVAEARAVVAAFAAAPNSGVLTLDGRMIDLPHRRKAERILQRAGEAI